MPLMGLYKGSKRLVYLNIPYTKVYGMFAFSLFPLQPFEVIGKGEPYEEFTLLKILWWTFLIFGAIILSLIFQRCVWKRKRILTGR